MRRIKDIFGRAKSLKHYESSAFIDLHNRQWSMPATYALFIADLNIPQYHGDLWPERAI